MTKTVPKCAAGIGATVGHEYVDQPRTGRAVAERTALKQLVQDASQGRFDIVLVEDTDRIGRDLLTAATFENACGLPVRYSERGVPGHTADHRKLPRDLAGLVDPERRRAMTMRQVAGRKAAKARLAATGLASPFPYEGKTPKLGRTVHAAVRKTYRVACQAGADRIVVARILNDLARSVELARPGKVPSE
jgi:DNA invertase Pin-like site-specific DNA recombinase